MDPNQTYHDMIAAHQGGDQANARELALALKGWFDRGGFCPAGQAREAIDTAIAEILSEANAEFSLTCQHCDAGMEISCEAEATAAGWTGIEYAPDLPSANYVGTCPDCQEENK